MARQVLDNGIVLPSEYSDDWYDDMTSNLTKLDVVIGSDAEKLDESDVGAAAISNDYDDLDDKPTYNILRRASVTLTAGGTGNYTDLDSDSKIKAGDYVLDAANKLYSITAIDTANSTYTVSSAAIINITDKSELGAAALSNDYDDLNNLPGYGILRFCSTAITDNSNVAFSSISSVSKIAAGDFLLDTAGKMYVIASVDTANETVSVTTPLTQLAVDSDVIHNTGNETKSGELTLNDTLNVSNVIPKSNNTYDYGTVSNLLKNLYAYHAFFRGQQQGDEYSSNTRTNLTLLSNRDTLGESGILFDTYRQNTAQGTGIHILGISIKENSVRYEGCRFGWYWDNSLNGYYLDFKPTIQGTYQAVKHNLGTSTDKWDTINGINPGALSFPDLNNGIDISGYITDLTGASNINKFTPSVNGWVSIGLSSADFIEIYIPSSLIGGTFTKSTINNYSQAFLPVIANKEVRFALKGSSIGWANFYPCLGNV